MSRGTTLRNVRVGDHLWAEAKAVADQRGENLSDVIRTSLAHYVQRNTKQVTDQKAGTAHAPADAPAPEKADANASA